MIVNVVALGFSNENTEAVQSLSVLSDLRVYVWSMFLVF